MEELTKICNTCGRELPATSQYFYHFKRSKDGFKSSCKECQGGRFFIKEKLPEGYRRCHDCKQILPETEDFFLKYWSKVHNRYYFKCHCLECGKVRCKQWREEKPELYQAYYLTYSKTEKAKESNAKWRENHKEEIKQQKKAYRIKNRDKIKAYDRWRRENLNDHVCAMAQRWRNNHKQEVSEYNKRYVQEHKDYFRAAQHKRNALKKQLPNTLTLEEWESIKAEFDYCCAYCGKKVDLTQEHFIPLSKGGEYTKENIIPACLSCNASKNNRDFLKWYKKRSFYSEERETFVLNYLKSVSNEIE